LKQLELAMSIQKHEISERTRTRGLKIQTFWETTEHCSCVRFGTSGKHFET
jgi:hypothetical protein